MAGKIKIAFQIVKIRLLIVKNCLYHPNNSLNLPSTLPLLRKSFSS